MVGSPAPLGEGRGGANKDMYLTDEVVIPLSPRLLNAAACHAVGLLLAAATLTAYPLWEEPGIAVLWWTANKVLTGWLYLLVRRVLVGPT